MELVEILKSKYSENNFITLARDLFKDIRPIAKIINIKSQYIQYIEECKFIADYKDKDGKKVAILGCKIHANSKARTIQRNFIAQELTNGNLFDYDAAFVAFYDEVNSNWKVSLVTFDINFDEKISFTFKPAKRFTFSVGPDEPSKTYSNQLGSLFNKNVPPTFNEIKDAFSVNRITDDFYFDYCDCFIKLSNYLISNECFLKEAKKLGYEDVNEFSITFSKKTLGQIVFLHFVQKKGWLGVPIGSEWGDGDLAFFKNSIKNFSGNNYFNEFLEPLFYNALNKKRENDIYLGLKIPFLNGGLFHPIKEYEWENTNFNIPNDIWYNINETGFLDILSQYNFTIDESDENEQEIAVDPEMLGKIFESLLDPSERHVNGAFYTRREIVNYLCVESLSRKLSNDLKMNYESIKNYILYNDALRDQKIIEEYAEVIDDYLSKYTVIDPAVGSGAFLVGMLNVIVKFRLNLGKFISGYENRSSYDLKKHCIQNNLFGVDIEFDAIEIAKLRLWLSLIVDQTIVNYKSPKPLPNLNFSLRVGNSIVDEYKGIKLWNNRWHTKKNKNDSISFYQTNLFGSRNLELVYNQLKLAKNRFFELNDEEAKLIALKEIESLQMEFIKATLDDQCKYDMLPSIELMMKKNTKPFFIWQLEFEKIFEENKGFDIVIFNPPYIDSETMTRNMPDIRDYCREKYESARGNWDLFVIFIELALKISNKNAVYSFIVPNKLLSMPYSSTIRKMLTKNSIYSLRDYASVKVFKEAAVYPITFIGSKVKNENNIVMDVMSDINIINNSNIVIKDKLINSEHWDSFFANNYNDIDLIIEKIRNNQELKYLVSDVKGAATVSEAYIIREVIINYSEMDENVEYFKFVNTGTIDPYISLWDLESTQYIKGRFNKPLIEKEFLKNNMPTRYNDAKSNKIIIAGMSKRIEAIYDEGITLAGKSTVIILGNKEDLKYILGILNSKIIQIYYKIMYNSRRMAGGYFTITPDQIKNLPIPSCNVELKQKICNLVDKIIDNRDVSLLEELDNLINSLYDVSEEELIKLEKYLEQ